MINKNKKNIRFTVTAIIFAILASLILTILVSCQKPEIYKLAEYILNSKGDNSVYNINAELDIKINKDYLYESQVLYEPENNQLDGTPDNINLKFNGELKNIKGGKFCEGKIAVTLIESESNINLYIDVYIKNNILYFELNDMSKIILNLLSSTGFLDYPVKTVFESFAYQNSGGVIYFDLKDIDLSWFEKYGEQINKTFKINSKLNTTPQNSESLQIKTSADIKDIDDLVKSDKSKILYFGDIKAKTEKELLKISPYRYYELNIILNTENNENFMNILGIRENNAINVLERVKIEADLEKIRKNPELIYSENIIPMRYLFELMGETVEWDAALKKAYLIKSGENAYFEGTVKNSRAYISLLQVLKDPGYGITIGNIGEYIEITIFRK